MAQSHTREVYTDGSIVYSNLFNDIGVPLLGNRKSIEARVITHYWDGTPMTDDKVDNKLYSKIGNDYVEYLFPFWGENFLEKDTMAQMRAMEPWEIILLRRGYWKGVRLSGYYSKNDTPKPIEYLLSTTLNPDNEGSVIAIGVIKLEYKFVGSCDSTYFGIFPDQSDVTTKFTNFLRYCADNSIIATAPDGYFNVNGTSNGDLGILCPSNLECRFSKNTVFKIIPTRSIYTGIFSFLESENVKINFLNVEGDKHEHLAPDNSVYKYWTVGEIYQVGDYVLNQVSGLRVIVAGSPTTKPELSLATNPIGSTITNGTVTFEVIEDVKESGHGCKILNSSNINIGSFNGNKCFGDGLYIGKSSLLPNKHNKNIVIGSLNADDNRRQGCSIITVDGLDIGGGVIKNTSGTNPQAGIDIEPNHQTDVIKGVRINNLTTESNNSYGITLYLNSLNGSLGETYTGEVDVKINNHTSIGDKYGFGIRGKSVRRIKGFIEYNNAVIVDSKLEGIILTDYINQPDITIDSPSVFNANVDNVISEISPSVRHTYIAANAPVSGNYSPVVKIKNVLSRNTNGKTRYAVYAGVAGRPDIAIKNTFIENIRGEGFVNGGLMYFVGDKDIVQEDISQLVRTIPTTPTTFEMTQQQSFKEYNNANATATNFIMLNPQIGKRRVRILNNASPTARILGISFKDNIGGIVGISQSGTFVFQSNATGAFLDLEYVEGSANLWRIINGGGIWRIVESNVVVGVSNLNGYVPFASTTVEGIVKQSANVTIPTSTLSAVVPATPVTTIEEANAIIGTLIGVVNNHRTAISDNRTAINNIITTDRTSGQRSSS